MNRVPMVGASGRTYFVPAANVEKAVAKGLRLETDDERLLREQGENSGGAFAEGAARGFTLGVSDAALSSVGQAAREIALAPDLGPDSAMAGVGDALRKEKIRARAEANPGAAVTGEVAGTLAGLAIAPEASGPGLAARAGLTAEKAVLGRAAAGLGRRALAKSAGAAAEGGLYGLGTFVSEASLADDPNAAAEKLFAATGGAALTGGILGGTGEVLATGLRRGGSALMSKVGGKGMRAALEDFAERQAVSAWAMRSDFSKGKLADQKVIGRYALDKGMSAADDVYALRDRFTPIREAEAGRINDVLKQVDERALGFDTARLRVRAEKEILGKIRKDPALKSTVDEVDRLLDGYEASRLSFADAWNRQSTLRRTLAPGDQPVKKEAVDSLRRLFRDEIMGQAGEVSPHFTPMLQAANRDYRSAAKMVQLAEKGIEGLEGNRRFGLMEMLGMGGIGPTLGGPGGLVGGVATAAVINQLKRRPAVLAVAADRLAKSRTFERVAKGLHTTVSKGLQSSPVWGGAFRSALERSVARGAMATLGTHVQLARTDPAYLAELGFADETPDAANEYAVRADQLEGLAGVLDEQDARADVAISRFLGEQGGAAPKDPMRPITAKEFKQQLARLEELATNVQTQAAVFAPSDVFSGAPSLGALVSATAQRAVQFLDSVAPKPPRVESIPALADEWEPSEAELDRWTRHVEAVERPQKVLEDLSRGTVTREAMTALAVVYPRMFAELQQRMLSRLAGYDKSLGYEQRRALSELMGIPMGGVGGADRTRLLQQMHAVTVTQENSAAKARVSQSSSNLSATQGQRIEGRGVVA